MIPAAGVVKALAAARALILVVFPAEEVLKRRPALLVRRATGWPLWRFGLRFGRLYRRRRGSRNRLLLLWDRQRLWWGLRCSKELCQR